MKNKLKIVFMGTPDFAVGVLKSILETEHEVVGVITAVDKPAGRGRKINTSAVKKYSLEQNLNLLQPPNLKDPAFIEQLKELKADIQIVVAFRMLPKQVWSMPKIGTFNLHASLLPQYRGAAPIHWAIINGETKTGVTTFFIDDKIDTGEIILKEEIEIKNDDTVGILHDKLMKIGCDLVVKTLDLAKNEEIETFKQENIELKTAYKLNPKNCKIDWTKNTIEVYNHIRGLNPFPCAWTTLIKDKKEYIKILRQIII